MTEQILQNFLEGLKISTDFRSAVEILVQNNKLKQLFKDCFIKNAFLFFLGTYALDVFLWFTGSKNSTAGAGVQTSFLKNLFVKILENLFFVLPMYTMSSLYNGSVYSDVAMISYKSKKATERNHLKMKHPHLFEQQSKTSSLSAREAPVAGLKETIDRVYSFIVYAIFLLQISITSSIPMLGLILQILQESWLFSYGLYQLYFDTVSKFHGEMLKDGNAAHVVLPELMGSHYHPNNLTSDQKFKLFEKNWAYFLGFGVPFAIVKLFFPFMMATGVWAMLYPFFIVLAVKASIPRNVKKTKHFQIEIFKIPRFTVNKILPVIFSYFLGSSKHPELQQSYLSSPSASSDLSGSVFSETSIPSLNSSMTGSVFSPVESTNSKEK